MRTSRRDAMKVLLAGTAAAPFAGVSFEAKADQCAPNGTVPKPKWSKGIEGQRVADLGDGTYINPIVAGDHPDPALIKDGKDYYMTFSPFGASPGVVIWHSTDLVNWSPLGPALSKPLGQIWAMDIAKHNGRYFIYMPAAPKGESWSIYVIWADSMKGPWSDPIRLDVGEYCIDPGHIVGEDGKRYLFVNGIRKIRLTDDGLAVDGKLEQAYDPWHYPEDWIVENFAPEGPKLMRHNGWFYLTTAVGGTAGPPTGHMVITARSKSVHGPWENCPHNPIVRTWSVDEPWWSRGHATPVEGPAGDWWLVYHAYENGFRTLGRQTILEPIEWTEDGWYRATGGDLSKPLPIPKGGKKSPAGFALSDDFRENRLGTQWSLDEPFEEDFKRLSYTDAGLTFKGTGVDPANSPPLTCIVGDRAYEVTLTLDLIGDAEGGLLLYYNRKAFVGFGFTPTFMKTFSSSEELNWARVKVDSRRVYLKLTNDHQIVTLRYSTDGKTWHLNGLRLEVSGFHQNVFGGFMSLRVGIYSAQSGSICLRNFTYQALEQ